MKPLLDPDLLLHSSLRANALGLVVVLFVSAGMTAVLLAAALLVAAAGALGLA